MTTKRETLRETIKDLETKIAMTRQNIKNHGLAIGDWGCPQVEVDKHLAMLQIEAARLVDLTYRAKWAYSELGALPLGDRQA